MSANGDIEQSGLWQGKNALVVDDYPVIRKTFCELAQSVGLNCFEADNGLDAQKMLKKGKIDLVVTDLVMPEMDGFELTEAIKSSRKLKHLPVIIISTHADSRYIFKALKLGADDYLTKPASREMLVTVLNRIYDHEW